MIERHARLLLGFLICAPALVACGDSGGTGGGDETGETAAISTGDETGATGDETGATGDETGATGATGDETGDTGATGDETGATGATGDETGDTGDETGDTGETGDETGDTGETGDDTGDTGDTGAAIDPQASIWLHDPITEDHVTTVVDMPMPTTEDGALTNEYVEVRNCLNEDGGQAIDFLGFEVGRLCHEVQTALPGDDGTYLHIVPPETYDDTGDLFAELMMYYHVNELHDYFQQVHGLTHLDFPLQALVNVSLYISPEVAGLIGLAAGWQAFPNAAFIPEEGFEQFMLPPRDNGAIVFGQFQFTDFAYDSSVIYHEYTHAMIGTDVLIGVLVDPFGLDNTPGAMNEGFADYFAATLNGDALIGNYALGFAGEQYRRDLTEFRRCPDDLTSEIHADGKIIGSAMWSLREAIGKDTTDTIVLAALQNLPGAVNFEVMGQLILSEAEDVSPEIADTVEEILTDHGVLGCVRAKEWTSFNYLDSADVLPYAVAGKQQVSGFAGGVPGYFQFYVDVPEGAAGVTLTYKAVEGASLGGLGGGGGGSVKLDVAIRDGAPVIFQATTGSYTADATVSPAPHPAAETTQAMTLTGACLPAGGEGRLYFMMLNNGQGDANINQMSVTVLTGDQTGVNATTCP